MESERWYRIHYLVVQLALSIYVSFAIIWDTIINVNERATKGQLGVTITSVLSAAIQFYTLNYRYRLSSKLFRLKLLRDNYSYWLIRNLNYKDKTKSLKQFKFTIFSFQFMSIFIAIFIFCLGSILESTCGSGEYFFNKWFGLAGALIFPVVRLFTTLLYIPNKSYKFFFRI